MVSGDTQLDDNVIKQYKKMIIVTGRWFFFFLLLLLCFREKEEFLMGWSMWMGLSE